MSLRCESVLPGKDHLKPGNNCGSVGVGYFSWPARIIFTVPGHESFPSANVPQMLKASEKRYHELAQIRYFSSVFSHSTRFNW